MFLCSCYCLVLCPRSVLPSTFTLPLHCPLIWPLCVLHALNTVSRRSSSLLSSRTYSIRVRVVTFALLGGTMHSWYYMRLGTPCTGTLRIASGTSVEAQSTLVSRLSGMDISQQRRLQSCRLVLPETGVPQRARPHSVPVPFEYYHSPDR